MSTTNNGFQELLKEQLHKLFPEAKEDGAGVNTLINCPLCNMEGRRDNNRHMSICLGYDGKPLFFNCWRNNLHRGLLTPENLEKLASASTTIPDAGFLELLDEYNRRSGKMSKYRLDSKGQYKLETVRVDDNEINEVKRLYICKRLGLDLSLEELASNKIIFSIKDLLHKNYIRKTTRAPQIMELLDKYYVGFLTNTNSSIILRNMVAGKIELPESISDRYIKYVIIQGAPSGYYIIPTSCNLYNHIDIHLAEGTFDILSIFYNLRGANRVDNVYGSIGGNSYLNMVEYFLSDLGIIDPTFHIYIDNDIKPHVLPEIERKLKPLDLEVYIHMNSYHGEKDFGVPMEKIQEYVYKLF